MGGGYQDPTFEEPLDLSTHDDNSFRDVRHANKLAFCLHRIGSCLSCDVTPLTLSDRGSGADNLIRIRPVQSSTVLPFCTRMRLGMHVN